MKLKLVVRICLLMVFAMQQANIVSLLAQSAPVNKPPDWNQVQERIKRVESSLLPPVIIKGEPVVTMNLAERMKHDVPQILDGTAPANTKPVRVIETPGTKWSYSGGGFTVVQLLMSDVSGKSFSELMDEAVLKKLGMKNSTYQLTPPDTYQVAIAHGPKGERVPFKWFLHPEMAAAGLWTTPSDLARFAIELQQTYAGKSKKVLSREMVKQMLTKQTGGWGLGISLNGEDDKAFRFSHGGANTGFRNRMIAYTRTGQGAVVMTNSEQGDALCGEILRGIAREYGWADYLTEKTIVQIDGQKFADYVGEYDFLGQGKYKVLIEDGKLKTIGNSGAKLDLLAESETKFFIRERPVELVFVRDASGRVTEMIINSNGQEIRLKKF